MSGWEVLDRKWSLDLWVPWAGDEHIDLASWQLLTRSERSISDSPPPNQLKVAQDPTRTRTYYIIEQKDLCNFLLFCFLDSNNKHIIAL